jgi:hypothetical protein
MDAFECGGATIHSYRPAPGSKQDKDKRRIFTLSTLDTAKQLQTQIAPASDLGNIDITEFQE